MSRLQLQHPMSLQVFEEYEQAQRTVDYLSDREFPVENVMIVGTDLKQVERVTGRLTGGKVLVSGAFSGSGMGILVGVMMWGFAEGGGPGTLVTGILIGALFGAIWAALAYRLTGGARDFTSVTQVVATRYEVLVEHTLFHPARRLLDEMRTGISADARPVAPSAPPPPQHQPGPYGQQAPGDTQGPVHSGAPTPPAAGPTTLLPVDPAHPHQAPAETPAPRYRTYGEALDAARAARAAEQQQPTEKTPTPTNPATPGAGASPQNPDGERTPATQKLHQGPPPTP